MATIKYFIRGKSELSTIYVRLLDGRKIDLTVSTGYTVHPKFWSVAKGSIRQIANNNDKKNLTEDLRKLKDRIGDSLNLDKDKGVFIDKEWLEGIIASYKNPVITKRTDYMLAIIEAYQEEMKIKINPKTGKRIAATTIRNFNTTIRRLQLFEKYKKRKYFIHEIDLTFHSDFIKFLRDKEKLAQNSISKDIKQIKTVCIDARDKGISINDQVLSRKFNAPLEPTTFVTITEDEIEQIKQFKGSNYLQNARDWLIIGCWTGCRVNDLMSLTKNNIMINTKGQKFIRYTQSKTGKQVDLPIHPDVQEIIDRLGDLPHPISDVKFNKWIKDVCKEAGLTQEVYGTKQDFNSHKKVTGTFKKYELIRSHTCRRSFATNHYNKLPNKLIMAVTGHSTEKMLLNYIGETENTHLDDFLTIWEQDQVKKNDESSIDNLVELKSARIK
jgi:integrase